MIVFKHESLTALSLALTRQVVAAWRHADGKRLRRHLLQVVACCIRSCRMILYLIYLRRQRPIHLREHHDVGFALLLRQHLVRLDVDVVYLLHGRLLSVAPMRSSHTVRSGQLSLHLLRALPHGLGLVEHESAVRARATHGRGPIEYSLHVLL